MFCNIFDEISNNNDSIVEWIPHLNTQQLKTNQSEFEPQFIAFYVIAVKNCFVGLEFCYIQEEQQQFRLLLVHELDHKYQSCLRTA